MKIEQNKVVAVGYVLTVDGNTVDQSREGEPLEYIHGTHMMIPGFEAGLEGLEEGAKTEFDVAPAEGYGEYIDKHKFEIPKSSFVVDGVLREELLVPGTVVPMFNSEGHIIQGTVAEVGDETVTMDFNHPLAGKTLHFAVEVVSVRDATEKELHEGLHGEFLPPPPHDGDDECGCGCGHHHHGHEHGEHCHHHDGEEHECCHGEHKHDGECCHHGDHEEGHCCHKDKDAE